MTEAGPEQVVSPRGVAWGLLAAWIVHDLEELLTMPTWSQQAPEQIRAVLPQVLVLRRYTPGLVTTPLVVIPYSVWAWRRLKGSGVPVHPSDARLNLLLAAVVPAAHTIARLSRRRS